MSVVPIFGPRDARWSIGSRVVARWWSDPEGYPVSTRVEMHAEGVVSRLVATDSEGWLVTVWFGPMFDSINRTVFIPSQIEAVQ